MLFSFTPGLGAGSVSRTEIFRSGKVIEDSDPLLCPEERISPNTGRRILSLSLPFSSLLYTDIYTESEASAVRPQECMEVSSLGNFLM